MAERSPAEISGATTDPGIAARPNDTPLITVDSVWKQYKTRSDEKVLALKDVNVTIGAGEFVSLVGPSGCGKTTLLKIIAGLQNATKGTVTVQGNRVDGPSTDVGMVFQSPVLLPWRSVLRNVMLPAEVLGLSKAEARDRAIELLKLVGLSGFENKLPGELSGGMRQRASIARALIYEPSVLLMDEPFGAVDAFTREVLNMELLRIWDQDRKTVIFVTHSISEAVFLSDRVVVMGPRPGRILEILDVPLSRPRSMSDLASPELSALSGRIRTLLGHNRDSDVTL